MNRLNSLQSLLLRAAGTVTSGLGTGSLLVLINTLRSAVLQ